MTATEMLEAEADRRRRDVAASLRKLARHLTPRGLANEALRKLDPEARAAGAISRSLKRNPLPALPLLLGLGWLFMTVSRATKPEKRKEQKALIALQRKD